MSLELISNIVRKPWAIDPNNLESITPFIVNLMDGKPITWEKTSSAMPFTVDARSSTSNGNLSSAPPGSIAVIGLSGPLQKNNQFCGLVGTATIGQWIQEAEANINIDGIILKIDSPGSTVDGTEDLARIIQECQKAGVKFHEIYTTQSSGKNKAFCNATNVGNIPT